MNWAVNAATGGIGGGAKWATRAGGYLARQGIEILGDITVDVGVYGSSLGQSLAWNTLGSLGGEAAFKFAGKGFRSLQQNSAVSLRSGALTTFASGLPLNILTAKRHTTLAVDEMIASGELFVVTARRAGATRGSAFHEHHIFPQERARMFLKRGIDVHDFVVDLPVAVHGAIHGGSNWKLARQVWGDEWNARIVRELRDATRRKGSRLTPGEIKEVGEDLARFYGIGTDFHRYSRAPRK